MRHSVFAGGKRVRPLLVLLAAECCAADGEEATERVLGPAAAMEMIHTFSLVHDDLPALDDDDLRRGRPTVHRQFDEATAVLAGDALLNLALETLALEPVQATAEERLRSVVLATQAVGTFGMIGGQVDDLAAESNWPDDAEAMLEAIHRRKTGALLTACLRIGGLYAGVSAERDAELAELGEVIGLMFQVADDILDIEGTEAALGKSVGKDENASKLTYPGLYGMEESKSLLKRLEARGGELASRLPRRSELVVSLIDYLARRDR